MRKFAVVTTFHQAGLTQYAQRMIDSYMETWPKEVTLMLYPEDCNPAISKYHDRIVMYDMHTSVLDLVAFKNKWKDIPKANGVCPFPERRPRDYHKGFKWDAVRFAHKVYSIFHAAKHTDADVLIWMDADMYCHSPISIDELDNLILEDKDLCYVGRERKWPECGLYSINLKSEGGQLFLKEFQRVYDDAENGIFTMEEWHDSFVFEEVRTKLNIKSYNWAEGLIVGEGHPLINSAWGAYIDHLKGGRKSQGKSKKSDLIKPRTETYWR